MKTLIGVIIALVVLAGVVFVLSNKNDTGGLYNNGTTTNATSSTPTNNGTTTQNLGTTTRITSPRAQEEIMSGFVARGMAPGGWLFEASTAVELVSATGTVLFQGPANVDEGYSWMTTELVPWTAKLPYDVAKIRSTLKVPESEDSVQGFFVFHKSNPSGLPEQDASLRVPVTISLNQGGPVAE